MHIFRTTMDRVKLGVLTFNNGVKIALQEHELSMLESTVITTFRGATGAKKLPPVAQRVLDDLLADRSRIDIDRNLHTKLCGNFYIGDATVADTGSHIQTAADEIANINQGFSGAQEGIIGEFATQGTDKIRGLLSTLARPLKEKIDDRIRIYFGLRSDWLTLATLILSIALLDQIHSFGYTDVAFASNIFGATLASILFADLTIFTIGSKIFNGVLMTYRFASMSESLGAYSTKWAGDVSTTKLQGFFNEHGLVEGLRIIRNDGNLKKYGEKTSEAFYKYMGDPESEFSDVIASIQGRDRMSEIILAYYDTRTYGNAKISAITENLMAAVARIGARKLGFSSQQLAESGQKIAESAGNYIFGHIPGVSQVFSDYLSHGMIKQARYYDRYDSTVMTCLTVSTLATISTVVSIGAGVYYRHYKITAIRSIYQLGAVMAMIYETTAMLAEGPQRTTDPDTIRLLAMYYVLSTATVETVLALRGYVKNPLTLEMAFALYTMMAANSTGKLLFDPTANWENVAPIGVMAGFAYLWYNMTNTFHWKRKQNPVVAIDAVAQNSPPPSSPPGPPPSSPPSPPRSRSRSRSPSPPPRSTKIKQERNIRSPRQTAQQGLRLNLQQQPSSSPRRRTPAPAPAPVPSWNDMMKQSTPRTVRRSAQRSTQQSTQRSTQRGRTPSPRRGSQSGSQRSSQDKKEAQARGILKSVRQELAEIGDDVRDQGIELDVLANLTGVLELSKTRQKALNVVGKLQRGTRLGGDMIILRLVDKIVKQAQTYDILEIQWNLVTEILKVVQSTRQDDDDAYPGMEEIEALELELEGLALGLE